MIILKSRWRTLIWKRKFYLLTGNLPDSEDVVQDTFVKVWLHRAQLQNESGFKAWMLQILVRTAYRFCKKKSREVPVKQRTVVILFYYQDCSVREIAAICGCMEGTVKSRLHTARTKLKKMLSEDGGGTDNRKAGYENG
jgi:RNA polymerase sigma-70 factor (ECF subfamily)